MSERKDPFYTITQHAIRQIVREEMQRASPHLEKTTTHSMHDLYGMTYRGYSFQELDKVIDFYLTYEGRK